MWDGHCSSLSETARGLLISPAPRTKRCECFVFQDPEALSPSTESLLASAWTETHLIIFKYFTMRNPKRLRLRQMHYNCRGQATSRTLGPVTVCASVHCAAPCKLDVDQSARDKGRSRFSTRMMRRSSCEPTGPNVGLGPADTQLSWPPLAGSSHCVRRRAGTGSTHAPLTL